jgi:hypothetical protein
VRFSIVLHLLDLSEPKGAGLAQVKSGHGGLGGVLEHLSFIYGVCDIFANCNQLFYRRGPLSFEDKLEKSLVLEFLYATQITVHGNE